MSYDGDFDGDMQKDLERNLIEAAVEWRKEWGEPIGEKKQEEILVLAVNDYLASRKKEVVKCLCGRNVCQVCGVCETHCKCQKKEIAEIEPINPSGRVIPIPKGMDGLVNVFYGYISETIQKLNEVIAAVNKLNGK